VKQRRVPTLFVDPIGHVQAGGDYRESWMPMKMAPKALREARRMAKRVTDHLGGAGLFGVEFFVRGPEVFFSELSPRPHDTGMVTMIAQNFSEFELHLRAILGLPIPPLSYFGPSASAVILADRAARRFGFTGLERALRVPTAEVRLFGKPACRPGRRMGVALARGKTVAQARARARLAASRVRLTYPKSRAKI
jgi:phosphoribosylglycinamide formyltransferase 2